MLRGINRQNVFLDNNDCDSMISAMREAQVVRMPNGQILHAENCTYYAYCILHNHIHILVREGKLDISTIMKRIENRFVFIYNTKYDRVGHLFQDRFRSEPVEDEEYFRTLLRYIHRNPVKAMEANRPEDYIYSSWREYLQWKLGKVSPTDADQLDLGPLVPGYARICAVDKVIDRFGYEELVEFVNVDVDDCCMDMDSEMRRMSDAEAAEHLCDISGMEHIEYFKQLDIEWQVRYLKELVQRGASIRQASRLSSMSFKKLYTELKR